MKNKDSYYLLDSAVKYFPKRQVVQHADKEIQLTDFQHKLLMYFLENPEQIRTQPEICQQVWPQKVTTVDAFNKPLGAIRNALGNHSKAHKNQYIKTWSREGYGLACQCEYIPADTLATRLLRLARPTALVASAALAIVLSLRLVHQPPDYEVTDIRRLTSLHGIAAEPSLSDDGKLIAFTFYDKQGKGRIMAKRIAARDPHSLTEGHNDKMPAISPSGDRVLYQRLENGRCQIRLLNLDEALEVKEDALLIHCNPASFFVSMSWHDKNRFYYTDASSELGPYAIYRFDLQKGLSTLYLAPEVRVDKQNNGFARVVYQRDKDKLYIIHSPDWLNSDILLYQNGQLDTLTHIDTAIGNVGVFDDRIIYKDSRNRLLLGKEGRSLSSEFNRPVMHPATSQKSNRIAYYVGYIYQWNIFSYNTKGGGTSQLTFDNAANRYPVMTEKAFYYTSDFTGITQVYRQDKQRSSKASVLSNFKHNRRVTQMTLSSDGKLLAISYDKDTELYSTEQNQLTLLHRFAGRVYPTFSPDARRILLSAIGDDGRFSVSEFRLDTYRPSGIQIDDARFAIYHPDGLLYAKSSRNGLYLYINGTTRTIDEQLQVFKPAHIAATDDTVYAIDHSKPADRHIRQISLKGDQNSLLPINHVGQLKLFQGVLYYTVEQLGETAIYTGNIVPR